jgi:hypothetical protein
MVKVLHAALNNGEKEDDAAIYFTSTYVFSQTTYFALYACPDRGPRFLQQRLYPSNFETEDHRQYSA